jgi:TRAP-type C4-dicarboxylate transport system substrate-binding protein
MKLKLKKRIFPLATILMSSALVLAACGGSSEETSGKTEKKEVYQLDFNNLNPAQSTITVNVMEPWVKMVEEKTDGRVKINLHHAGALGSIENLMDDIKGGVYDMAETYTQELEDTNNHALTVGDLPFTITNDLEVDTQVIQEYHETIKDEVLQDYKLLTLFTAPPSHIYSKEPIEKVEDFKGLKVRAGTATESSIYKDWGMVPVDVARSERYDALQKGIIDVLGTANFVGLQSHFQEVAPHHVELPYKTVHGMLIMNKDSWEKLPDDLKDIFEKELIPAYAELTNKTNTQEDKKALEEIKKGAEGKGSATTFPEAEVEKLKEKTTSAKEAWIKSAKSHGLDGEALIKKYEEIQEKVLAEKK